MRSTEKDNERTSGLKSEFMFGSEFANRTTAGYTPGFAKIPFASRAASAAIAPDGHVKHFELRPDTDALCVSSTAERPMLFGGSILLHQKELSRRFLRCQIFPWRGSAPRRCSVTPNHLVKNGMETLLDESHQRNSKLEMNLIAVMLGRKQ